MLKLFNKFRYGIFILVFIFLLEFVSSEVIINEIMYNPGCSSDLCEWIELYSNDSYDVDLSDWKIDDEDFDNVTISSYGYIVISKNLDKFIEYYGNYSFVVDGSFSLNNNGDNINLSNENYSYFVSYNDTTREDYSLEFFNGNFYESAYVNGSFGFNNSVSLDLDYSVIRISEFLPDPIGNDSDNMPNGEYIELYNNGNFDLDLNGLYFYDNANHKLIISDVTTVEGTNIKVKDFLVIYMNGFYGFLNNDEFEEIRLYDRKGNLIDKVSYGSLREGVSWSKVNDIWQMTEPSPGNENIDNKSVMKSSLKIENVYDLGDNYANWGDLIRVRLNVYKGDESKNNIKVWIEKDGIKISKISSINVEGKFLGYTLTLPVQIDNNNDGKYKDGTYYIIAEGLEKSDKESVKIKSNKYVTKGIIYDVDAPSEIESGNGFLINFNITNNDEDKNFEVWSYIYRGSKSYSGDRESNLEKFRLRKGETNNLILKNEVNNVNEGDYKLKIMVKESDKKTPKEFTKDIKVIANAEEMQDEIETNLNSINNVDVVYESKQEKIKRNAIFFFCVVLIFVILALVKK